MKKITLCLLAATASIVNHCHAQPQKIIADKIVARIGDKIVLHSDIVPPEELEIDPKTTPECYMLASQLTQKCFTIEADKDSLLNSDELENRLDNQIENFIVQYGGRKQLEDAAHKSIYEIRNDLRTPFTERFLADAMRKKITAGVKITPAEVKAYFDKIPADSLPYYESEYDLQQIIIYPRPNKDVEEYAINQLLTWKQQVETGKQKFDALAKLYSQDPGSTPQGGIYNVNKNDKQWDATWFAAIWKLKEGQVSPVIKTKFGLHIIQMVSRAGDDAVIRHILLMPSVTNAEIMQATARLDSIRMQLLNGKFGFNAAVNEFSEDENGRNNGGQVAAVDGSANVTIDQFDRDMAKVVQNMQPGDISKPMAYKDDRGRDAVRLIYLRNKTNAHVASLQTDYTKITTYALEQKKNNALQQWLREHVKDFSVSVDKSLADCDNVKKLIQD